MFNVSPAFWWIALPCWSILFLVFWVAMKVKRSIWTPVLLLAQTFIVWFPYFMGNPVNLGLAHNQLRGVLDWPLHLAGAGFVISALFFTKSFTDRWEKDEHFVYSIGRWSVLTAVILTVWSNVDGGRPPGFGAGVPAYIGFVGVGLGGMIADINESPWFEKRRWLMKIAWLVYVAALSTT